MLTDFIIRDCGSRGFLPIIRGIDAAGDENELYRGEHKTTRELAYAKLIEVWEKEDVYMIGWWKRQVR